jgi:ribosomal protein L12E/L44/L45/RPP1/RPP2
MIRSRDRSFEAKNRRRATENVKKMKHHIDTKVTKRLMKRFTATATAKEQAFENFTLRQFSRFERVQMKTIMSDEMMNSTAVLAVHRADSVSNREREREENDHENEDENENENDEDEDKQYRNRLSIDTKTDDAKCEDVVNRLRFIKLKRLKKLKKKNFLSKRKVFFFNFFEMRTR